jgi:hypothetical protein
MTQRRSGARVADRPRPGTGAPEIVASKQPSAACGKGRGLWSPVGLQGAHKCHWMDLSSLYDVFVT